MSDFESTGEISINATAENVFGIISDFTRHKELAGLGRVHTKQPEFDTIQVWKLQKLSTNA